MGFDFSVVQQKPNNWLPTHIEYEGEGSAEFQDPKGRIWGRTRVVFDEFGGQLIEMQVEGLEPAQYLLSGIQQLLSADRPKVNGGQLSSAFPPEKYNLCVKLTVKTPDGEFIAENIESFSFSFQLNEGEGEKATVGFHPRLSRFDSKNANPARYWTLPLVNFVSEFMQYDVRIARHPLRIYPDAIVPPDVPSEHKSVAEYIAKQKSHLILFEFNQALGFIEPLPDYEEKEGRLLKRQIPSAITSVMVGELGNYPIGLEEMEQWFPFYLLDLLALATGNEVASPWMEFMDEQGNLVSRIHPVFGIGHAMFIQGQKAIDEVIHRGTGRLLTVAQTCPDLHESYLLVALKHTVLGGRQRQSIEDKMDHLCRGLDALCEHYGLSTQNLLSHTQPADKDIIQKAIQQAVSVVQSFNKTTWASGDVAQSRYLQTVIGRLSNTTNQERKFGLAVGELLDKFSFIDTDILDRHYANNPRKDNLKKWADVVSHYRGRVIHTGYFNLKTSEHEFEEIWSVIQHLHDILLRILLTVLLYDGKYQPTVARFAVAMQLGWIKPDTTALQLGYK